MLQLKGLVGWFQGQDRTEGEGRKAVDVTGVVSGTLDEMGAGVGEQSLVE